MTQAVVEERRARGVNRAALPRHRHARALGAGLRLRPRGARGERCRRGGAGGARLHADARRLARHPGPQPGPLTSRARRRHRGHALAQSARGRRLQVQPAPRWSRRHGRHAPDRGARERWAPRAGSSASSASPSSARSVPTTTHWRDYHPAVRRRPAPRRRPRRRWPAPVSAWASTCSAARASATGR